MFARVGSVVLACAILSGCALTARPIDQQRLGWDFRTGGYVLPDKPVLILVVDGLRKDVLLAEAAAGNLPRLKRLLLDRAAEVATAVTGVPSVTCANCCTLLTGCLPGHHGITGNHQFDPRTLILRDYERPSTVGFVNLDLKRLTVHELLDDRLTASSVMQMNRGVKMPVTTYPVDGGGICGAMMLIGAYRLHDWFAARFLWRVGAYSAKAGRWPDLLLLYNISPDAVGHELGHDSDTYRLAVRNLDNTLGGVLETLEGQGVLDRFTVVLTADHGHHRIHRHIDLPATVTRVTGVEPFDEPLGEGTPYVERAARLAPHRFVLVHDGARKAHLHVRPGATWLDPRTADADPELCRRLAGEPGLAIVAAREGADGVRVFGKSGTARVERRVEGGAKVYRYTVVAGADPLGCTGHPASGACLDGRFHPSRTWLTATADSEFPDAVAQLVEAFDAPRMGDVLLFAEPGCDFSEHDLGGHGGLHRDDMTIPLFFAGPGFAPGSKIPVGRLCDVVPTILDSLGLGDRAVGLDGVSLLPRRAE